MFTSAPRRVLGISWESYRRLRAVATSAREQHGGRMHARGEAEASPRAIVRCRQGLEPLRRVDGEDHPSVRQGARLILLRARLDLAGLLLAVADRLELPRREAEPFRHHVADRFGPATRQLQVVVRLA